MIGVAVIGLGNALQPHARSLLDLADRVRVVWAASLSEGRAQAAAERYGFPATTDIDRAINDPAVDAVLVLTPANAHLPVAEAAFAAGKHVFCEKPLEVSLERGERLIAAGRRADRRLAICLQLRFRPGSRRLRVYWMRARSARSRRRRCACRGGGRNPTTTNPAAALRRAMAAAC